MKHSILPAALAAGFAASLAAPFAPAAAHDEHLAHLTATERELAEALQGRMYKIQLANPVLGCVLKLAVAEIKANYEKPKDAPGPTWGMEVKGAYIDLVRDEKCKTATPELVSLAKRLAPAYNEQFKDVGPSIPLD